MRDYERAWRSVKLLPSCKICSARTLHILCQMLRMRAQSDTRVCVENLKRDEARCVSRNKI